MGGCKKDLALHTCSIDKEDMLWFLKKYRFPPRMGYMVPRPSDTIKKAPQGKIGLYFAMFEVANIRLPFTPFFLSVLHYFGCHVSQITLMGAAKITMFEACCRAHDGEPTVELFRRFYKLCCYGDWFSMERRSEPGLGECITDYKDSLKGWKSRFFYVDSSIVLPRYYQALEFKDVLDTKGKMSCAVPYDGFDVELYKSLLASKVVWRTLPKEILYLDGLSKTWAHHPAEPLIWGTDGKVMDFTTFLLEGYENAFYTHDVPKGERVPTVKDLDYSKELEVLLDDDEEL